MNIVKIILVSIFFSIAQGALAQSFSINPGAIKTPDGETFNALGKSYRSESEACNSAKEGAANYAKSVRARDFSFGSCGCSSRKLEGPELWAAKARENRDIISEYACGVDMRVVYIK